MLNYACQVFFDSSCSVLGFPVIQAEWKQYSKTHFKLHDSPSSQQILAALRTKLPRTLLEGQVIFEYLASVVSGEEFPPLGAEVSLTRFYASFLPISET